MKGRGEDKERGNQKRRRMRNGYGEDKIGEERRGGVRRGQESLFFIFAVLPARWLCLCVYGSAVFPS